MYTQNDEQTLIHTQVTLGEHETNHCIYVKINNNLAYYTRLHI